VSTPLRNNKPYLNKEENLGSVGRREIKDGEGEGTNYGGIISLRKSVKK
jgi:hypothetical protein